MQTDSTRNKAFTANLKATFPVVKSDSSTDEAEPQGLLPIRWLLIHPQIDSIEYTSPSSQPNNPKNTHLFHAY